MENGYVECTMTTCAVTGAAGSGKSHTISLVLNEDPPDIQQSTGLVEPVRAFSTVVGSCESGSLEWSRVDENKLLNIVAGATSLNTALPLDKSQDMHTQEQPESSSQADISEQVSKSKQDSHSEVEDKPLGIVAGGFSMVNSEEQPVVQISPFYSTSEENTSLLPAALSGRSDTAAPPSSLAFQALPLSTHTQKLPETASESGISNQVNKSEQLSHKVVDEQLTKLGDLLKKPVEKRQVTKLDFLYFLDSGGQPQFHELLPSFVPNLSTILFVLKLSEKLSQRPNIEYYKEGKSVCSYQSPHSHEQILKHCIRALQPEKSVESGSSNSPHVAVVCTHRDKESECEGETRREKNQQLLDLLEPRFGTSLIFYETLEELIYPVNAKNPNHEDRAVACKLREAIICNSDPKSVQIPLPWFILEQVLRKLAKERGTGVMNIDECRKIASRLHIKPNSFDAALKYLVSLNIFLYYPTVLPKAIFCVPQVFLDKINELVQHFHIFRGGSRILPGDVESISTSGLSGKWWLRFRDYGLLHEKLLHDKAFSRHYDDDLFTPADFLKLLECRLIVGKVSKQHTEYVMPSLLFELESENLDKYRCNPQTSPAAPLLVHFPGEWPASGVFCSVVASLLSTQNWEVMTGASEKPICLYRNCFQFRHPRMPGSITLIDSFDQGYFEVHVDDNAPLEACTKFCPEIRRSVFAALPSRASVKAEVTFFCPNPKGDRCCPSSLHLVDMITCNYWHCSENPREVHDSLEKAENMTVWGINKTSASGIALLSTVVCHFSCFSSCAIASCFAVPSDHGDQIPTVGDQQSEVVDHSKLTWSNPTFISTISPSIHGHV